MNVISKCLKYCFIAVVFVLFSCARDSEDDIIKLLSYVESSLPTESLSAKGGTFTIEVESARTIWRVFPGDVVSGNGFIESASPGVAGTADGALSQTSVIVSFESNGTHSINRQELVLASLDGQFREKVVLTQDPLGFEPFELTIDPATTYQTISGFGGANMIWGTDNLTNSEMELAFGTENGLGLSILRVRLSSDRNEWAGLVNIIRNANGRGVTVMASPWSPPARWKSNNSINGGGFLLHEHYDDFANYINEFILFMSQQGARVDIVSIQNEPDIQVSYEGCEYTIQEMYNFVRNYAGLITGARVMAAESFHFNRAYTDDILNCPIAVNNLDIVGFHIYGGGKHPYPLAESKGKELWMSEHLHNLDSGNFPGNWTAQTSASVIWDETMQFVTDIHDGMTYNWNAYIWWYIRRYYSFLGDGTRGTTRGTILKRGFAMSQYSKFIRPGYVRIGAEFDFAADGIKATAYKGDGKTVVVMINTTGFDYKVSLVAPLSSAKAYTTSLNVNREEQSLTPAGNSVIVGIPSKSITTVVF